MRTIMKISIVLLVLMSFAGCVTTKNNDGTTKYSLSPIWGEKLEKGGEAAVGIAEILAPFLGPAGGLAFGSLASGLALFKKYKPKLTQSQTKAELSHTVATISVDAIEQIKKEHPEVWKKLSNKLQKKCDESGLDSKIVKNAIRGLRGLPPKV